ncbi:MAG: POTRA domain-containing protein [Marivibrio sp.]|uniref:ShlB/FhaC/HecB family hemolysin secretion/activation protein n=1 Tax=Marivibrio sp. TaxID=2039719 RepID=UPI0032EF3DED
MRIFAARSARARRAAVGAALIAGAALSLGAPAAAQESGAQASGANAAVQQRVEEVRPGTPEAAPTDPQSGAPTAAPQAAPTPPAAPDFVLAGVVIDGAEALPVETLAALYEPYLARMVDGAALAEIAGAITRRYREAGFILSRAEIPPQSVDAGILRIRVVEGYIGATAIEGLEGAAAARAKARLAAVEAERPTRLSTIDRAIALVEEMAGVSVRDSRVEALDDEGAGEGAHRLIVQAAFEKADVVAYADNRGDREVGPMLAWFGVGANDAFGAGERIEGGVYTVPDDPQELLYGEVRAVAPLGSAGTVIDFALSGSASESGGNQDANDLIARSRTVTLGASHPLILSRRETLTLRAEAQLSRLSEEQRETQTYEDRTRVAALSLDYRRTGLFEGADVEGAVRLDQGFDVLGANGADDPDNSLADGSGAFTSLQANGAWTQALPAQLSTRLALRAQVADRALLTGRQLQLGGARFGRAYGYGEVAGEHGAAGLLELRRTGRLDAFGLGGYQLYGFYDLGAVWDRTMTGGYDRESLTSAGVGLRVWSPGYGFYADAQLAQPLTRIPDATDDDAPRFFLGVSGDF